MTVQSLEHFNIDHKLCSDLLSYPKKYNRDKICELVSLYLDQNKMLNNANRTIEELQHQIMILEAENKFLKEDVEI